MFSGTCVPSPKRLNKGFKGENPADGTEIRTQNTYIPWDVFQLNQGKWVKEGYGNDVKYKVF